MKILVHVLSSTAQLILVISANNNSYFGDIKFCEWKIVLKPDVHDNSSTCEMHLSYAKVG